MWRVDGNRFVERVRVFVDAITGEVVRSFSLLRDAQAQVVLAEASQRAIQKVTEAIKENQLPVMYLLGEKYIDAVRDISASQNAKVVVLPADLPAAVKGLLNTAGKSV